MMSEQTVMVEEGSLIRDRPWLLGRDVNSQLDALGIDTARITVREVSVSTSANGKLTATAAAVT